MRTVTAIWAIALLAACTPAHAASNRVWTAASGQQFSGVVQKLSPTQVSLRGLEGKTVSINRDALPAGDQEYLSGLTPYRFMPRGCKARVKVERDGRDWATYNLLFEWAYGLAADGNREVEKPALVLCFLINQKGDESLYVAKAVTESARRFALESHRRTAEIHRRAHEAHGRPVAGMAHLGAFYGGRPTHNPYVAVADSQRAIDHASVRKEFTHKLSRIRTDVKSGGYDPFRYRLVDWCFVLVSSGVVVDHIGNADLYFGHDGNRDGLPPVRSLNR